MITAATYSRISYDPTGTGPASTASRSTQTTRTNARPRGRGAVVDNDRSASRKARRCRGQSQRCAQGANVKAGRDPGHSSERWSPPRVTSFRPRARGRWPTHSPEGPLRKGPKHRTPLQAVPWRRTPRVLGECEQGADRWQRRLHSLERAYHCFCCAPASVPHWWGTRRRVRQWSLPPRPRCRWSRGGLRYEGSRVRRRHTVHRPRVAVQDYLGARLGGDEPQSRAHLRENLIRVLVGFIHVLQEPGVQDG